ncbi:hypothetical protein M1512_04780 [Patescibacteria group bacterium]|nr:hypothetical protein [Patescibacteria group bacterium]
MLKLKNDGDTIVEVLIALAVLSLAFAISYATASRALQVSQNSQEHSQALEYLDAQVEALRYVTTQPDQILPPTDFVHGSQPFCFVTSSPTSGIALSHTVPCKEPGNGFNYLVEITPDPTFNYIFHFTIIWPGLGSLGQQKEQLSYKVYPQ